MNFNRPTREWAKWAGKVSERAHEWSKWVKRAQWSGTLRSEWAVRANEHSERPSGPLKTRSSLTRNAPLVCGKEVGVRLGIGCPCSPIRNDIVSPPHLFRNQRHWRNRTFHLCASFSSVCVFLKKLNLWIKTHEQQIDDSINLRLFDPYRLRGDWDRSEGKDFRSAKWKGVEILKNVEFNCHGSIMISHYKVCLFVVIIVVVDVIVDVLHRDAKYSVMRRQKTKKIKDPPLQPYWLIENSYGKSFWVT